MGIPAILHEHANHSDTPWFQKVADRLLAPHTDLAIAVSESTGEFTTRARLMPAERTKVVYLGAPLDEFARPRTRRRDRGGARGARHRARHDRGRHDHAADAVEGQPVSGRGGAGDRSRQHPERPRLHRRRRRAAGASSRRRREALGLGDRLVFTGFTRDVAAALSALDIVVFPSLWEGTPLTVFEALAMGKPIVATDADGLLDVLTDRKDALIVPKADAGALARRDRRADRAARRWPRAWSPRRGRPARATTSPRSSERWSGSTSCCTRLRARRGRAGILKADLELPDHRETMTRSITRVAARLQGRSPAWRLGAATTAAIGVVLLAWALSVDFAKASDGFFGDAATYYTLGHSLADDLRLRVSAATISCACGRSSRPGPKDLPQARQRRTRICTTRRRTSIRCSRRRSSGCSAPTASWCCTRC